MVSGTLHHHILVSETKIGHWSLLYSPISISYEAAVEKCQNMGATMVDKDSVDEVRF